MSKSTVYLHIGAPKTGTTALQYFLYENRSVLEKNNICYPDFQFHFPGVQDNRNAHFFIQRSYDADRNRIKAQEEQIRNTGFEKLQKYLKQFPTIILSEESIWNEREMNTEAFTAIRERLHAMGADLKIIVYLRRQDQVIPSYWAQLVKSKLTMSFEEFISTKEFKRYRIYYANRLEEITKAVGTENIIVRVYENQQFEGTDHSLFSDFLNLFGIPLDESFYQNKTLRNVKLEKRSLEVKRMLNQNPAFQEKKSFIVPVLQEIQEEKAIAGIHTTEIYFSKKAQQEFLNMFEHTNQTVARKYLHRQDGILFYEPLISSSETVTQYSAEELVALCGKIMLKQQQQIQQLQQALTKRTANSSFLPSLAKKLLKK